MAEDKTKRIRELIGTLRAAGRAYYQESREIMSNFEYDKLYDELVSLEKETGIVFANSPTQNVGYEVVSALPKERHEKPMLSLNKTKSVEELADWLGGQTGLLSWKMGRSDDRPDLSEWNTCQGGYGVEMVRSARLSRQMQRRSSMCR